MLRAFLLCFVLSLPCALYSQIFWTEDFGTDPGGCASTGQLALSFDSGNGQWTVTEPGAANPNEANVWYVSAAEAGMGEGNCGDGCGLVDPTLTNNTLHIGEESGDNGASYDETGFGFTETDTRAESPVIDCTGQEEITMSFLYLAGGNPLTDICTVQYFDGTDWSDLGALAPTALTCGVQGVWTAISFALPASADNNPAVQIGFRWVNLDNGDATDPSVAIDDITLVAAEPVVSEVFADFTVSESDICDGECVDFTDTSIGDDINFWEWTFEGAETPVSNNQNPVGICYQTPGTYEVTLFISSPDASDELTISNMITVEDCSIPPIADFSSNIQNICEGDCINFTDLSEGGNIDDWDWNFVGADTPGSNDQNPVGVCYSAAGSYDVTLTVTNEFGTDVLTLSDYITVIECDGPVAGFTASETTICEGECVDFINQSIGGASIYSWTFAGADTPNSADENPAGICYAAPGQYDVILEVSDGVDLDTLTLENFITVEVCTPPVDIVISADANVICIGDCVSFEDETETDNISDWNWTFPGGNPAFSTNQTPPDVCYLNQGSYNVTLELTIDGQTVDSTFTNFITVVDTCGPVANFSYTPIVCLGQCYSFTNTSTGGDFYFWTFEGALPETSEEESPAEVCYLNQTGIFNVTLTVVNQFGSSTSITQQVTVVNPPIVNAGPDQSIIQGMPATLSGTAGNGTGQFIWQPFEDVTCFDCPTTSTYPLNETTTFVLYYEQSGGCMSSDTVTVFVEQVTSFGVPSAFSPNGDGVNDILYVRGNNLSKMKFVVYNRYGQMVFESYSQNDGWDGTMNGRKLNGGVFGYYLEAFFSDGTQQVIKGDITLVR